MRAFQKRVQIADQFITKHSFRPQTADSIELAANEIVSNHGGCRIDSLAHDTGLSIGSFQRMFKQRIGVSPKLYARIVRFESALKTKAACPHISWTTIAHEFGYHDHMHMIHDFEQFSGENSHRPAWARATCTRAANRFRRAARSQSIGALTGIIASLAHIY